MRLELKDIGDGGLTQEFSCQVKSLSTLLDVQKQEDVRFAEAIDFRLRFQKSGQLIEVDGSFTTKVDLSCGRCLQAYEQPLSGDFSLTYTPLSLDASEAEAEELELDADELGLVYYKDETLDLTDPLQEQVLMALPIAPVCQESCRGLCPECGCDLNKAVCSCEKKPFNSKFTALSGLKLDDPSD